MYVFVTCNFFIITGPLLESTRLDGPDDQETLPYQQQDNDDQPTIPYSNDDRRGSKVTILSNLIIT